MMRAMMVLVVAALPAAAEDRRELGAHEHGHSVLNIAIEGGAIAMELIAPGADIVGFEHAASTAEQRAAAVEQARAVLADPLALFLLPAHAGCALESAEIALETEEHEDEHAEDHDAEEYADAEDHDADAEEHGHEASHSAFHAEYAISCASPDHLGGIGFAFFEPFPGAREIEVTVITETGQTRYEVERDAPRIDLKGLI
jgi:hypothetical protein